MSKLNKEEIKNIRLIIKDKFAQNPSPKDRFYEEKISNHLGDEAERFAKRDEFSRDADRILYSKAFRRLEHKAQVYSNKKGDHYRTRLTHTLEVTQIARSISRNLGLNEHLTEAIALGHDIGHTPFGHAGEKVLDKIMGGEDDLGGKINYLIDYGGFKHNFNSLKILEIVEKRYESKGLNLTWQTLDGILKHTRIIKEDKKWDLNRFVRDASNYENIAKYSYFDKNSKPEYQFPLTLEGQVVAISDEIAQREHDLDDSLRDGNLFKVNEMSNKIISMLTKIKKSIKPEENGYELFNNFYEKINENKLENNTQWRELSSRIISYFIIDVTENTLRQINSYKNNFDDIIKFDKEKHKYITKEVVKYSSVAKKVDDEIKDFIEKRIIYSFEVNRFDGKGEYVLRQLFKAYYENPRQMPRKQLIILVKNIEKIAKNCPILEESFENYPVDFRELYKINEDYVDLNSLDKLLNILKISYDTNLDFIDIPIEDNADTFIDKFLKLINLDLKEMLKNNYDKDKIIKIIIEKSFNYSNMKNIEEETDDDCKKALKILKAWNELHYEYLSVICNYISQMTDNYAIKEYKELYLSG